ncbi:MAG: DUF1592 domain-containing protein, partial [Planctomycetota bacterium]
MPENVDRMIQEHCVHCHDENTETSLDLTTVDFDLASATNFKHWQSVFDRVEAGEMPPQGEEQPDAKTMESAMEKLRKDLHAFSLRRQRRAGRVPARRLTKYEYSNTIQDLLHIQDEVAVELPAETDSGRFNTIGQSQRLSSVHMAALLRSADRALDAALQFREDPYRDFKIDIPNSPRLAYHDGKTFIDGGGIYLRAGQGVILFTEADFLLPSHAHGFDVPMSGDYKITIEADAFRSETEVIMKVICKSENGSTRLLSAYDVQPGDPQTFVIESVLHPGDSFYPTFVMGEGTDMQHIMAHGMEGYNGKGLAIRSYRVEGPLFPHWPPPSTNSVLPSGALSNSAQTNSGTKPPTDESPIQGNSVEKLHTIIEEFSRRAFRAPLREGELEPILAIAEQEFQQSRDFVHALRAGLKATLTSPQFLLFDSTPGELDDHALASRLSYFLWRSMPDEQLIQLADQGKLSEASTLRSQVERMLNNEKCQRFVQDFLGQWLRLYKIHANTPDQRLYWEYDELLGASLVQETELFFASLIEDNLPAENLIDSNFTFLNRRLAEHYRIHGVKGQQFRRVPLPKDSVRGGVLTQASVLKTTANGSLTSPVIRGNFVLSNFLGVPPPPPPPSAGSIEPDTRGTKTLREQLAAHRDVASCNS